MKLQKGFSLIEILVATFIFVIVLFFSMIIFSNTLSIKNRSQQFENAQESMAYPIELISRDIREAYKYQINNPNCPSGIVINKFNYLDEEEIVCYFLNSDAIAIKKLKGTFWTPAQNLSSSNVTFSNLRFEAADFIESQNFQPHILISAKLETSEFERKTEKVELDIRTAVTLRNIDWKFKTNE